MRRAARSTFCGFFMWLPEPRSSPAPHLEGQRWLSDGRFHCADAITGTDSRPARMSFFMTSPFPSIQDFINAFVVKSAGHLRQLVAELALVRRHTVRVERLARAPDLDHGEVVRAVGLLHPPVPPVPARPPARPPPNLAHPPR